MSKKSVTLTIDQMIDDLYSKAGDDFEKRLLVMREKNKLEMMRLKVQEDGGAGVPDFFTTGEEAKDGNGT